MKVLFDTNVILDLLLAREPFANAATQLVAKVEQADIEGRLCATTVTTIHYIVTKKLGAKQAALAIDRLLHLFDIAIVSRSVLLNATTLPFRDYEDAVLHEAARVTGADAIVSRNLADFPQAQLPVYDPPTLLALLQGEL
ncbi:MAG: PIN domain nuclease [Chloroflexi bacterium]|nr:MAG: PIN domain nuclease [Chloroflexota bacterium]